MGYIKISTPWQSYFWVAVYTLILLLLQAQWISRLPYHAFRADLLLPLMFGIAVEWPPLLSLLWACVWGYAVDALSGKFWGFHVGSYVVAVCMVNIAVEKFEFHNPLYQVSFVGVCALGQSAALGLYLCCEPVSIASMWISLVIRSMVTMALAPFIIYPVWNMNKHRK